MTPQSLRTIRERAGLSRAGFAELMGISVDLVISYELVRVPIREPVAKLATILDRVGLKRFRKLAA